MVIKPSYYQKEKLVLLMSIIIELTKEDIPERNGYLYVLNSEEDLVE